MTSYGEITIKNHKKYNKKIMFLIFNECDITDENIVEKMFVEYHKVIEENPGRLRHERTLKILFLTFIMSLLCFSFLAVKLLEFRWLIPIFIVLSIYSINYLRFFSERFQRLLFELSFLLSIILYARFFFINGIA